MYQISMALASTSLLKSQTPLQQLLEEINFQRTKEMRQLLKDDSGFVVLQGTTYWTDLFVRHFLFQSEPVHNIDSDDLLFFVRKKHVKGSSRHMPKFETEVDVYRKDSRKLPIGDPDVDWEETVYLNMVIHQFDYTLTLAICTRTSPKELQVLRRHSQRVYASPSRRKMDTKGEGEEMTYPHICFMVDNFDEVFSDILVRDGEMVCVELVASDKDGSVQGVIFLGSIRYDALKKVYDARQSSLSSKVAQRMTFGLFSSGAGPQTRCEFVRMKGPQGKGHAEMAVTKPKGSGIETPTSEPGFCATDMWDEWDDDGDDFYCRHQRRLSDPSANLNNFTRYGWRTKHADGSAGAKARSENEGLDSLASEVSEIEAGDLRDDRPASSASETKLNATTPTCCNCFGPKCKRWSDTGSEQMSDVYCRACEEDTEEEQEASSNNDSPACLSKIPSNRNKPKHRNLLNIENELIFSGTKGNKKSIPKPTKKDANKSLVNSKKDKKLSNVNNKNESNSNKNIKKKPLSKNSNKNDLKTNTNSNNSSNKNNNEQAKIVEEYELADDATSLNGEIISGDEDGKMGFLSEKESQLLISVHGKEELPAEQTSTIEISRNNFSFKKCVPVETKNHPLEVDESSATENNEVEDYESEQKSDDEVINKCVNYRGPKKNDDKNEKNHKEQCVPLLHNHHRHQHCHHHHHHPHDSSVKTFCNTNENADGDLNGNNNISNNNCCTSSNNSINGVGNNSLKRNDEQKMSTLPKVHKKNNFSVHQNFYNKALRMVPKTTTPDGTNIYYWCDLPKKALKELDDGAYNPLWATRGFTQTFHFWKENRRQQSTPLNAFLTYVTLPWWSIAKDLLDHRETPILTF